MTFPLVVVIIAVLAVAVAAFAVTRVNRSRDGVDSFRRQIDALSPEARRPVVDQVQQRIDPRPERASTPDEDPTDAPDDDDHEGESDGT